MNGLKILGIGALVVGAVANIVSGIVGQKQTENKIASEVAKQLAEKN